VWGYWIGEERPVSKEFIAFLRGEQKRAIRRFLHLKGGEPTLSANSQKNHAGTVPAKTISSGKPSVRHNA
jgi:hypothetical protein